MNTKRCPAWKAVLLVTGCTYGAAGYGSLLQPSCLEGSTLTNKNFMLFKLDANDAENSEMGEPLVP